MMIVSIMVRRALVSSVLSHGRGLRPAPSGGWAGSHATRSNADLTHVISTASAADTTALAAIGPAASVVGTRLAARAAAAGAAVAFAADPRPDRDRDPAGCI